MDHHLGVASRHDTQKAIGAKAHGVRVMTYPEFQQYCLARSGIVTPEFPPMPAVDYYEAQQREEQEAIDLKIRQAQEAARLADEAKRKETAHYEANPAFGMF